MIKFVCVGDNTNTQRVILNYTSYNLFLLDVQIIGNTIINAGRKYVCYARLNETEKFGC